MFLEIELRIGTRVTNTSSNVADGMQRGCNFQVGIYARKWAVSIVCHSGPIRV